jgi:hypothetical protein
MSHKISFLNKFGTILALTVGGRSKNGMKYWKGSRNWRIYWVQFPTPITSHVNTIDSGKVERSAQLAQFQVVDQDLCSHSDLHFRKVRKLKNVADSQIQICDVQGLSLIRFLKNLENNFWNCIFEQIWKVSWLLLK